MRLIVSTDIMMAVQVSLACSLGFVRHVSPRAGGRCPSIVRHSSCSESWQDVTSITNQRVKAARVLATANGRKKSGLVLLEGHRLVCDALEFALEQPGTCKPNWG